MTTSPPILGNYRSQSCDCTTTTSTSSANGTGGNVAPLGTTMNPGRNGGSGGNPGATSSQMMLMTSGCSCAPGIYNISGLSIGSSATGIIGTNINPVAGGIQVGAAGGNGGDEATSNAETLLSSNAKFQAISAIAVSQDGVINVADRGE